MLASVGLRVTSFAVSATCCHQSPYSHVRLLQCSRDNITHMPQACKAQLGYIVFVYIFIVQAQNMVV